MTVVRTFAVIIFLFLIPLHAQAAVQGFARLSLVEGNVQLRSEGDADWLPAAVNTPLIEGDSVWCPAGSRAEVQLADGSVVRLDGRTSLEVVDLETDFSRMYLGMGCAGFFVPPLPHDLTILYDHAANRRVGGCFPDAAAGKGDDEVFDFPATDGIKA